MNRGGSWLIVLGAGLVVAGILWRVGWLGWFGHLPGDVRIEREGMRVFMPITSMILVSVVLNVLVFLTRRLVGS